MHVFLLGWVTVGSWWVGPHVLRNSSPATPLTAAGAAPHPATHDYMDVLLTFITLLPSKCYGVGKTRRALQELDCPALYRCR